MLSAAEASLGERPAAYPLARRALYARAQAGASRSSSSAPAWYTPHMTTHSISAADLEAFRRFCDDVDYFNSIWDQVSEEHPDSYVAVYGGRVVAVRKALNDLIAELEHQGVPRNSAVVRYYSSEPALWIL